MNEDSSTQSQPTINSSDQPPATKYVLTSGVRGGETIEIENPTDAQLQEAVEAIDWQNPPERTFARVVLDDSDGMVILKISGALASSDQSNQFRAALSVRKSVDANIEAISPPLENVADAVELLQLVKADRKKLIEQARANWTPA